MSQLCDLIAMEVLQNGVGAQLLQPSVESARNGCVGGGDITSALDNILGIFAEEDGVFL